MILNNVKFSVIQDNGFKVIASCVLDLSSAGQIRQPSRVFELNQFVYLINQLTGLRIFGIFFDENDKDTLKQFVQKEYTKLVL